MIPQSINRYFWFGTCVRYLQDATEELPIHGGAYVLFNLKSLFEYLDDLNLLVTSRVAHKLHTFMEELGTLDPDAKLTGQQATNLKNLIKDVRTTLEAELEGFEAYVVTPKRLDVKKLIENAHELFPLDVFWQLPEIAINDFYEAGKCIAFERPTAAAFHLLRGTESTLRHYYCTMIKRKRCDLMWGLIVNDLRKKTKTKSNTTLIDNLDNIRKSFRNPTQHPEKIYDIDEVQDLWGLCVDVVNRMIKELPDRPF